MFPVVLLTLTPFWSVNQPFPSVPGPVQTAPAHPPVRNRTLFPLWLTQTEPFWPIATCRPRFKIVASSCAPALSVADCQYATNDGTLTAPTTAMIAIRTSNSETEASTVPHTHDVLPSSVLPAAELSEQEA